jgi:DNA replication and repair protein RecF
MQAWAQDRALGHTTVGPHRGDLLIHQNRHLAHKVLSRGQWKLFICALLLARAQLLRIETQKTPIFLIYDLEAELDGDARKQLCAHLHALSAQSLITGISESALREAIGPCAGGEDQWFHVEQGVIHVNEEGPTKQGLCHT